MQPTASPLGWTKTPRRFWVADAASALLKGGNPAAPAWQPAAAALPPPEHQALINRMGFKQRGYAGHGTSFGQGAFEQKLCGTCWG